MAERAAQALTPQDLFQLVCDEAFRDGAIDADEKRVLLDLGRFLRLKPAEATDMLAQSRARHKAGALGSARRLRPEGLYRRALAAVVADGAVSQLERLLLTGLRRCLGIDEATHKAVVAELGATRRKESKEASAERQRGDMQESSVQPSAEPVVEPSAEPVAAPVGEAMVEPMDTSEGASVAPPPLPPSPPQSTPSPPAVRRRAWRDDRSTEDERYVAALDKLNERRNAPVVHAGFRSVRVFLDNAVIRVTVAEALQRSLGSVPAGEGAKASTGAWRLAGDLLAVWRQAPGERELARTVLAAAPHALRVLVAQRRVVEFLFFVRALQRLAHLGAGVDSPGQEVARVLLGAAQSWMDQPGMPLPARHKGLLDRLKGAFAPEGEGDDPLVRVMGDGLRGAIRSLPDAAWALEMAQTFERTTGVRLPDPYSRMRDADAHERQLTEAARRLAAAPDDQAARARLLRVTGCGGYLGRVGYEGEDLYVRDEAYVVGVLACIEALARQDQSGLWLDQLAHLDVMTAAMIEDATPAVAVAAGALRARLALPPA